VAAAATRIIFLEFTVFSLFFFGLAWSLVASTIGIGMPLDT